jgi:NAD-dependent dihydropyrimidine dehydrogenase PreA subunit
MTLSMKNPMGILPRPDRRAMHTFGIDQCIVDMNLGLQADLHIVDGSVGQDGEGPLPKVIDLTSLKVDYTTCQRCLLCYEACPEHAIHVKGYSGTRQ